MLRVPTARLSTMDNSLISSVHCLGPYCSCCVAGMCPRPLGSSAPWRRTLDLQDPVKGAHLAMPLIPQCVCVAVCFSSQILVDGRHQHLAKVVCHQLLKSYCKESASNFKSVPSLNSISQKHSANMSIQCQSWWRTKHPQQGHHSFNQCRFMCKQHVALVAYIN